MPTSRHLTQCSRSLLQGRARVLAQSGFSLIELMVSLAVFGIIVSLALPSLGDFLQRVQIERYAMQLRAGVHFAKQEAARTGQRTTLCRRVAGQNLCSTDPAGGWHDGWLVFHDVAPIFSNAPATDGNNQYDAAANESLLKVADAASAFTAVSAGPNAAALQPYVAFSGQGTTLLQQDYCIKLCALAACASSPNNRYLIVTTSGHARLETETTIGNAGNTGICS